MHIYVYICRPIYTYCIYCVCVYLYRWMCWYTHAHLQYAVVLKVLILCGIVSYVWGDARWSSRSLLFISVCVCVGVLLFPGRMSWQLFAPRTSANMLNSWKPTLWAAQTQTWGERERGESSREQVLLVLSFDLWSWILCGSHIIYFSVSGVVFAFIDGYENPYRSGSDLWEVSSCTSNRFVCYQVTGSVPLSLHMNNTHTCDIHIFNPTITDLFVFLLHLLMPPFSRPYLLSCQSFPSAPIDPFGLCRFD